LKKNGKRMRNKLLIKKYPKTKEYKNIHVIINPASGKDEPILNVLNTVFSKYGINWTVDITKKFGDATKMAMKASRKADLILSYGGDGTLHEVINGVLKSKTPIGILPGGTGNGFGAGLGLSKNLKESLEMICTSKTVTRVDVARLGKKFFISRMYIGIEPEEQTSRELKDKYGVFAYGVSAAHRSKNVKPVKYSILIDGKKIQEEVSKCYVVNSGSTGMNISIGNFDPTDGILDVFTLGKDLEHIEAATERFLGINKEKADMHYWKGKKIKIATSPSQPVWADGEFMGRTPVVLEVIPKAVTIVVPDTI